MGRIVLWYKERLIYEGRGGALPSLCERMSYVVPSESISPNLRILINGLIGAGVEDLSCSSLKELKIFTNLLSKTVEEFEKEGYFEPFPEEIKKEMQKNLFFDLRSYDKSETIKVIDGFKNLINKLEEESRHTESSIYYKSERILKWRSFLLSDLAEKMLILSREQFIEPKPHIIDFIESWEHKGGGNIDQLHSREEVQELSRLIELAVKALISENYYKSYDRYKDGQLVNDVFEDSNYFIKRTHEIATYEWKDDNLLIGRAHKLSKLKKVLLYFAYEKKINPDSELMHFLYKLYHNVAIDIEIYSKNDLIQFIELLERALKALINSNYFSPDLVIYNKCWNYEQETYQTYIRHFKEMAINWGNLISEEWKARKISNKVDPVPYLEVKYEVNEPKTIGLILITFIRLLGCFFLLAMLALATFCGIAAILKYITISLKT